MLPLGTPLPAFRLPDYEGREVSSEEFHTAPGVLVAFICGHCPYVKHMRQEFAAFAKEYRDRGLAIVGIMSNDAGAHPEDGPAGMKAEAAAVGYTFPYLFDESQAVAKSFRAACTPDLFLFDSERKLVYRGQLDSSRPGRGPPRHRAWSAGGTPPCCSPPTGGPRPGRCRSRGWRRGQCRRLCCCPPPR